MKRQITLIKIFSIAAILSAGMSMTSFAEWRQVGENGGWTYYGDNGEMITDQILELDGNYYYLGEDGLMASNQWVSVANENAGEEGEPEKYWYYFQGNGKAYRRSDSTPTNVIRAKEIDGKKYAFDTEGRMLYGWVSEGERQTGEDAWEYSDYYFGQEDDGSMKVGWQRLAIVTDLNDEVLPDDGIWEDEDQERWFYFSETGKKTKGKPDKLAKKTIHGQKYGFDEYGRMISSWYADPNLITTNIYDKTVSAEENLTERQGGSEYSKEFMYFGTPESGARYTKGWFRARPSRYLMESKHLEDETYMYYADGDGNLYANEIRTIDGEKYAFDNYGRQIKGLVCLTMEDENARSRFELSWFKDKEGREFSTEDEFNDLLDYERYNSKGSLVESYRYLFDSRKMRFYYFNGLNGKMLTGKQNVMLDDEMVEFVFEDSGPLKGSGLYGKKDDKLYQAGLLLKPEEGQKYAIVKMESKKEMVGTSEVSYDTLHKISVRDFIDEVCNSGIHDEKKDETVWTVRYEPENVKYYLISQNGKIVKSKKNAKDDDGYQFYVKNNKIKSITVEE